MNELLIILDRQLSVPLYIQIYNQIKKAIIDGTLHPNTSLPSIRKLSNQLQVNKMTIENAYDQLAIEGLIESLPRSGFFVKDVDLSYLKKATLLEQREVREVVVEDYNYNFHLDHVDVENFPMVTWRKLMNEVFVNDTHELFKPGDPQGDVGLRIEIADYVRRVRGVNCTEQQVIIGSHSQVLLALICDLLKLNGKEVAIAEPGYHLATYIFERFGCQITPILVEDGGLRIEDLEHSMARVVFTSPSFQFPFGSIMTIQKRLDLLEWAIKHEAYIIEDDYLSEFRYFGELIPSLQNLDRDEKVIYMGTFHGTLLPAMNIGYMILPPHLIREYQRHQMKFQQTTSCIEQKALELFMKYNHWEQHRFRMKEVYQKKYEVINKSINDTFNGKATVQDVQTGLHVILSINCEESEETLLQKAKTAGINMYGFQEFWYTKKNNPFQCPTFLLGFGGITIEQIPEGVAALYRCWFCET